MNKYGRHGISYNFFPAYENKVFNSIDKKLRTLILLRDNYTCQKCRFSLSPFASKKLLSKLQVHHKDFTGQFDEVNDNQENLIILCWTCHGKTHTGSLNITKVKNAIHPITYIQDLHSCGLPFAVCDCKATQT